MSDTRINPELDDGHRTPEKQTTMEESDEVMYPVQRCTFCLEKLGHLHDPWCAAHDGDLSNGVVTEKNDLIRTRE